MRDEKTNNKGGSFEKNDAPALLMVQPDDANCVRGVRNEVLIGMRPN